MRRSALIALLALTAVPAHADDARVDLVRAFVDAYAMGLPVEIGSARWDPVRQAVVLDAVSIGQPGNLVTVTFNELAVEDPRRTAGGLFAAHTINGSGFGATIHVDMEAWFPEIAEKLKALEALDDDEEDGDDVEDQASEDGVPAAPDGGVTVEGDVSTEVTEAFDVTLASDAVLWERIEVPMAPPDLSYDKGPPAAIASYYDWTVAARTDWFQADNFTLVTTGFPGGDQSTRYTLVYLAGLHDGRVERSGADGIEQTATVDGREQTTNIESVYQVGVDMNALRAVFDPAAFKGAPGDGRWRTFAEQVGYTNTTVTVPEGTMSIGSVEVSGLRVRPVGEPLADTIVDLIANPKSVEDAPDAFLRKILPSAFGLYGIDLATMTDFKFEVSGGGSFHLGRFYMNRADSDGIGAITLRDVAIDAGDGLRSGRLDLLTVNAVRFGSLGPWLDAGSAAIAGSEPSPADIERIMTEGMPAVDFFELGGLEVSSPETTFTIDGFAQTNSEYIGQMAGRYDFALTRLSVPVSSIADEMARSQIEAMGYSDIVVSGALSARYDKEKGEAQILDLTVSAEDMSLLSMDLTIGNLPYDLIWDPERMEAHAKDITFVGGSLTVANRSIVERIFEQQAKPMNQDPEVFRKNFGAGLPFMLGFLGDPDLQKAFAGPLAEFIADPKSLVLTARPKAPVPASVLEALESGGAEPGEVFRLLGLEMTANR